MNSKKLVVVLIILALIVVLGVFVYSFVPKNPVDSGHGEVLSLEQVTDILQTSPDFAEFLASAGTFDPELGDYLKLGPAEYQQIKPKWQQDGFEDRTKIIDELNLTDSTYWVQLKNKRQGPDLLTIVDINQKTTLLVMGSIVIKAGVGL